MVPGLYCRSQKVLKGSFHLGLGDWPCPALPSSLSLLSRQKATPRPRISLTAGITHLNTQYKKWFFWAFMEKKYRMKRLPPVSGDSSEASALQKWFFLKKYLNFFYFWKIKCLPHPDSALVNVVRVPRMIPVKTSSKKICWDLEHFLHLHASEQYRTDEQDAHG